MRELASELHVVLIEADGGFSFRAGQYVPVVFPENEQQLHYYSIASAPDELGIGRFELLVGKPKSGPLPPFREGTKIWLGPSGGERILVRFI
jgi:NAD(P)H-flavin reductase